MTEEKFAAIRATPSRDPGVGGGDSGDGHRVAVIYHPLRHSNFDVARVESKGKQVPLQKTMSATEEKTPQDEAGILAWIEEEVARLHNSVIHLERAVVAASDDLAEAEIIKRHVIRTPQRFSPDERESAVNKAQARAEIKHGIEVSLRESRDRLQFSETLQRAVLAAFKAQQAAPAAVEAVEALYAELEVQRDKTLAAQAEAQQAASALLKAAQAERDLANAAMGAAEEASSALLAEARRERDQAAAIVLEANAAAAALRSGAELEREQATAALTGAEESAAVLLATAHAVREQAAAAAAEATEAAAALRAAALAERERATATLAEAEKAADALRAAAQDEWDKATESRRAAALAEIGEATGRAAATTAKAHETAAAIRAEAQAERDQAAAAAAEARQAADTLRAAAQAERDQAAVAAAEATDAAAALKSAAQAERDRAAAATAEASAAAAVVRAAAEQERKQAAEALAEARAAAAALIASAESERGQAAQARAASQEAAAALLAEAHVEREAAVAALAAAKNATSDTQQIKIVELPPPPSSTLPIYQAIEGERLRIARDLHDGPSQILADLVLKAEILERTARKKPDLLQGELDDFKGLVRNAMADMRRFMFDLRPDTLDDLGLVTTLRRYASEYHDRTGVTCSFNIHGEERMLPPEHEEALFRIVQEALTNVQRHAGAKTAEVSLAIQPERVAIRISDDGVGFDTLAHEMDGSRKLGIIGMRERAAALGGTLAVHSGTGGGTEVIADFPVA